MAVCRTLDEIWAQGAIDGADDPPLTQAQADRVAAILASWRARTAVRTGGDVAGDGNANAALPGKAAGYPV